MNGLTSNNTKIRKKLEWYDIKCPYRSRCGTGTGVLGVFLLVWVQPMDRYEHQKRVIPAPGLPPSYSNRKEFIVKRFLSLSPWKRIRIGLTPSRSVPTSASRVIRVFPSPSGTLKVATCSPYRYSEYT